MNNKALIPHEMNRLDFNLSVVESNLIFHFISKIDYIQNQETKKLEMITEDFNEYNISYIDLKASLKRGIDYNTIKNLVKNIKPIEINGYDGSYEFLWWFEKFKYNGTTKKFTIKLHKNLMPYLEELKQYLSIDMDIYTSLTTTYSKKLYLLLHEQKYKGFHIFNVDDLRIILKTPNSSNRWDNFKNKVLDISIEHINKNSDLYIDYEVLKNNGGKTITDIKFNIKKNKNFIGYKSNEEQLFKNFQGWFLNNFKYYPDCIDSYKGKEIFINEDGWFYNALNKYDEDFKNKEFTDKIWERLYNDEEYFKNILLKWKGKK
jgi:plasmid replication initiation protein